MREPIIMSLARFNTGTVKTTYRIERFSQSSEEFRTVFETDNHDEATTEYESLRNGNLNMLFRMTALIHHVERVGRGRVYD